MKFARCKLSVKIINSLLVLSFGALILSSCGPTPIYEKDYEFGDSWFLADSVYFDLPAPDTSRAYAMTLSLRHTQNYPFQNIYLKISTLYPSGRRTSNLLNIDLADKSGAWYGDCGRSTCVLVAPLRDNFYFSEAGKYKITMEQYTRLDPLSGLKGIELKLYEEYDQ